jgi:hypothetical protein
VEVPTIHIDLLSLEHDEEEEDVSHIDVRCRRCEAGITFWPHSVDALKSTYHCNSGFDLCGLAWTWYDLHRGPLSNKLHHFFYTDAPIPMEEMWKMETEYYVGKTAYSYLREATFKERMAEAEKRLEIARAKVTRQRSRG